MSRLRPLEIILLFTLLAFACGQSIVDRKSRGGMNLPEQPGNTLMTTSQGRIDYHVKRVFTDWSLTVPRAFHESVWVKRSGEYFVECSKICEIINGFSTEVPPSVLQAYNEELLQGKGYFTVFDRDFRIRNPLLFLENYNYSIINPGGSYIGRDCVVARITSQYSDRPNFTVWIDKKSSLVLKYTSDTIAMNPQTVMEVTEIDLAPDFTGVPVELPSLKRESITPNKVAQYGFALYVPKFQPPGFQPTGLTRIELTDRTVIRWAYCDGVQEIVIGEYEAFGSGSGAPPAGGMMPEPVMGDIREVGVAFEAGFTTAILVYRETQITIRASLHEMELLTLIESLQAYE